MVISEQEAKAWNTQEALMWLQNDEPLYNMAKKCKTWKHLKAMWGKYAPKRTVNTRVVDWKQIYEDFKEDREGELSR